MAESGDLSPEQWVTRLGEKLKARWPRIDRWERYYVGDHDLPVGPSQYSEAYKRFQRLARTNLCALAVDSMVHRLAVDGYRDGTPQGGMDQTVWGWWQGARLDARQTTVYRRALSLSAAYVIVGADARPDSARVTVEHPRNVIVETDPADASRRLAALRVWHDPIVKRWHATLYLPGRRLHMETVKEWSSAADSINLSFQPDAWRERAAESKSTQTVPVVEFANGDEGDTPRAEFSPGMDVQDRLNLTILNRLTAERYAAYRQRYAINLPLEDDPETGLPVLPFKPGTDQVWAVEPGNPNDPTPQFGDFAQTDTSQMLRGAESDMRSFAAVTVTPVYYLPGDLVNIGADAVAALDAGHIAKCKHRQTVWGEGWEEVLELHAEVVGSDIDLSRSEIVWRRPENFNPAQVADYASKLTGAGYPLPVVAEKIGETPQQITRLRTELAAQRARDLLAQPQPRS